MENNYSVIMAGGIGSRFWPMSVPEHPKQFLDILGTGKSLIQLTYERLINVSLKENIYVVTNASYKELVLDQLPDLQPNQVLTEPERKNTAPCIAYAAAKIHSINPNANLIVTPADHLILNDEGFKQTIETAVSSAEKGQIATIGIKPTRPDTGYGYIEIQKTNGEFHTYPVEQFREKPDLKTAESFVQAGNFFWNAGIFIWKTSTVLDALKNFQPKLYDLFAADLSSYNTNEEQSFVNQGFHSCDDISVDYAIMEQAKNIDVVVAKFDWSDLGTWGSLDTHLNKDSNNNSVVGKNVHLFNSKNCIINVPNNTTAIFDGLDGHIVVQSDDRLMIIRKESEQDLKKFLNEIK